MVTGAALATINRIPVLLCPAIFSPDGISLPFCSSWNPLQPRTFPSTIVSSPSRGIGIVSNAPQQSSGEPFAELQPGRSRPVASIAAVP